MMIHFVVTCFFPLLHSQTSGLPLKCSMKFQINLRLSDLSAMAHVSEFTDMNVPLLWFDIVSCAHDDE